MSTVGAQPLPRASIDHALLIISRKDTLPVDLNANLRKWIEICFGEKVAKELAPLCQLMHATRIRLIASDVTRATSAATGSDLSGVVTNIQRIEAEFAKYDAMIELLIRKLFLESNASECSVSNHTGDIYSLYPCIEFTWYNCFHQRSSPQPLYHRSGSLLLEKCAIRFNLACILIEQAALLWRDPSKRLRTDVLALQCKLYQKAAGIMEQIREEKAKYASATQSECLIHAPQQPSGQAGSPSGQQVSSTMDLASDWLQRFSALLLAQAQECFYAVARLSLEDQRKKEAASSEHVSLVSLAASGGGGGGGGESDQKDPLDAEDHKEFSAAAMQVSYFYRSVCAQSGAFSRTANATAAPQQQQPSLQYGVLLFEPPTIVALPPVWQYHTHIMSCYFQALALAHHAQAVSLGDQGRFDMKIGCLAKAKVVLDDCVRFIEGTGASGPKAPQELLHFARDKSGKIQALLQEALWCNTKVYHKTIPTKEAVDAEVIHAESNVSAAYTLHENVANEVEQEMTKQAGLFETLVHTLACETGNIPLLTGARERLETHVALLSTKIQAVASAAAAAAAPSAKSLTNGNSGVPMYPPTAPVSHPSSSISPLQSLQQQQQQQQQLHSTQSSQSLMDVHGNRLRTNALVRPLLAEACVGLETLSHYASNYKPVGYIPTGFASLKADLEACTLRPLLATSERGLSDGLARVGGTTGTTSGSVIIGLTATSQLLSQGLIEPKYEKMTGMQALLSELLDEFEQIKKLIQAADETVLEFLDSNYSTILCWTAFQQVALREAFPQTIFGKELFNFRSNPAFKHWQQSVEHVRQMMIQSENDMQECTRMYGVIGATHANAKDACGTPEWMVNYNSLQKQFDLARSDTARLLDVYREYKRDWTQLHAASVEDIERTTLSANEKIWLSRIQQPSYCSAEERDSILARGSIVHVIVAALLVPRAMLQACMLPIVKDTLRTYATNIVTKLHQLPPEQRSALHLMTVKEASFANDERAEVRAVIDRLKRSVMSLQAAQQELFQLWYRESYGKPELREEIAAKPVASASEHRASETSTIKEPLPNDRAHRRLCAILRYWSMILWVYESERALAHFSKQLQTVKSCMKDAYSTTALTDRLRALRVHPEPSATHSSAFVPYIAGGGNGVSTATAAAAAAPMNAVAPLPQFRPVYAQDQALSLPREQRPGYVAPFTADSEMYNEN